MFGELVEHARASGATVVTGRAEPHLAGPLHRRLAVLGAVRRPIVHSHDPQVQAHLASSASLLTNLDGEWFTTP